MKSILISINPKWCEKIASGEKTVEVRKTKPKLETPFKVYIYCTKDEPLYRSGEKFWCGDDFGNGKVIGEFVCDEIIAAKLGNYCNIPLKDVCLDAYEFMDYADDKPVYGWHISDLVIYAEPRELSEFANGSSRLTFDDSGKMVLSGMERPPQSWCYVEEVHDGTVC